MVKCMWWLRRAVIGTTKQYAFSSVAVLITSISLPRAGRGQSSTRGDRAVRGVFCQWARRLWMVLPTLEFMGSALKFSAGVHSFTSTYMWWAKVLVNWSIERKIVLLLHLLELSETSSRWCPFFRQHPDLDRIELLSLFRIFKVRFECHFKYKWLFFFKTRRWEVKCIKCDVYLGHNYKVSFLACLHSLQIWFYVLSLLSAVNKWMAERTAKQLREWSHVVLLKGCLPLQNGSWSGFLLWTW